MSETLTRRNTFGVAAGVAAAATAWLYMPKALAQTVGITPCGCAQSLSVTSTSSNILLSTCGPTVTLFNTGAGEAFFNAGSSTGASSITAIPASTSSTASWSLPGNSFVNLNMPGSAVSTYVAAVAAPSVSTTIRVMQGWAQP